MVCGDEFKYRHLTDTIIIPRRRRSSHAAECSGLAKATIKPRLAKEGTLTDLRDMRREQAKARTKRFQGEEIGPTKFKYLDRSPAATTTTTTTTSTSQRQFERWARVDLVVSIRVDVGLAKHFGQNTMV
jgi:hypothetical protein